MKKAWIIPLLAGMVLLAPLTTGEPGLAVVDMTEVFKAHPETAKAEKALAAKRAAAGKAFNAKTKELKDLLHKHQEVTRKLVEAGEGAEEATKAEAERLLSEAGDLEREVAALHTTNERDLKQEFLHERKRILEDVFRAVAEFNSEGTYALILDRSAASSNGIPQVVHAPGAVDITADIIAVVTRKKKGQ
jgi:Skp family chaperone for outer membrane proteins